MESPPYNLGVPRRPRSSRGARPKQGAHLLALRQAAGLTQIDLAKFLGVPQPTIAFWEWSDKPPRSDVLPKLAKALHVPMEKLIVDASTKPLADRPGPMGEVQKVFEEVRKLPRRQQRHVVEIVSAIVERYRRKAS
jgi:transcriptional regulator with XRE-family HTH domain